MYTGYTELNLTDEEYTELYSNSTLKNYLLHENEYVLIKDDNDKILDYFQYRNNRLNKLKYPVLENSYTGKYKPRNPQQYCAFDLLLDPRSKVKVLKGVYGSGKDALMLSAALELVEKGKFAHIIYIRPNIIVRDLPDIGALPGTADEKLSWTLGPFIDKLGGIEGVQMLIQDKILEVVPLIYIRGRSFENSIIYVSEGQNMTTEIVKLLLGRVGENSELWINGDTHQTDKSTFDRDNGLDTLINCLKGNPLFSYIYLPITERSKVANLANLLDNYDRNIQNN